MPVFRSVLAFLLFKSRFTKKIVNEKEQTIVTIDGQDYNDIKKILKYIDTIKIDKQDIDWLTDEGVSGLKHTRMFLDNRISN